MLVLLSIKPEFASLIFDGSKRFEYRKAIFKHTVTRVIVYASAPVSQVIGEFTVEGILCDEPNALWDRTKQDSGISEQFFNSYFSDRTKGYAIRIGETTEYSSPISLQDAYGVRPPQSFLYLSCPLKQRKRHIQLSFLTDAMPTKHPCSEDIQKENFKSDASPA